MAEATKLSLEELFNIPSVQETEAKAEVALAPIPAGDVITPQDFILACAKFAQLEPTQLCEHFGKPRSWYYRMLGLTEVQEKIRQLRSDGVILNPSIGASLEERFRANVLQCTDILSERLDKTGNGEMDSFSVIKVAELGVKAMGMGQKLTAAERIAQLVSEEAESEDIADKLIRNLKEQRENFAKTILPSADDEEGSV